MAYKFADRRPGDLASNYADPSLAEKELGWKATRRLLLWEREWGVGIGCVFYLFIYLFLCIVLRKCVRTHGGGKAKILMDLNKEAKKQNFFFFTVSHLAKNRQNRHQSPRFFLFAFICFVWF